MACDAAFDAHARDRFVIQKLRPVQRPVIEYQSIAGRQLGRDAMGRREVFGDPFVLMRAGFGSRQLTHAPMRAANQLDRGLLAADGRQRQPYIEARFVIDGAAALGVGMPLQPSVPVGHSADAANIGDQIRRAERSVGLARQ